MKKFLLIVLIIGIAITGSMIIYKQFKSKEKAVVENLLPGQPIAFVHMVGLEQKIEDLVSTEFWNKLEKIRLTDTLKKLGGSEQDISSYENFYNLVFSASNHKLLKDYFGKEVALAMYSGQASGGSANDLSALGSNLVIITRLDKGAQLVESLSSVVQGLSKDAGIEPIKYNGYTLNKINTGEANIILFYFRYKDFLIASLGENVIKSCVDVLNGKAKSLVDDSVFLSAQESFLEGKELKGYVNFDLIVNSMMGSIMKMSGADKTGTGFEESFKQFRGFKTIGFSGRFDEVAKFKIDMHFVRDQVDPSIRPLYSSCPASDNATLNFIPRDVIGYQWATCFDADYFWKRTQKDFNRTLQQAKSEASSEDYVSGIEEKLGLSFEKDILPILGNEIGGYLSDIDLGGIIPVPKIVFFVKAADKAKAEQVIESLLEKQPLFRPEVENYKDQTIKYVNIPLMANIKPGYCFINDYFFITTDKQTLVDSIDAMNDNAISIVQNKNFRSVDYGLTEKSNNIMFLENEKLMHKSSALLNWANKWIAMQTSKQNAFQKGSNKRLEDIRGNIKTKEDELVSLKKELTDIRIAMKEGKETDKTQIVPLVKAIKKTEQEIAGIKDAEKELETIVNAYDDTAPSADSREIFFEEVVRPLVNALSSFKVFSSRAVLNNQTHETFLYMRMQ